MPTHIHPQFNPHIAASQTLIQLHACNKLWLQRRAFLYCSIQSVLSAPAPRGCLFCLSPVSVARLTKHLDDKLVCPSFCLCCSVIRGKTTYRTCSTAIMHWMEECRTAEQLSNQPLRLQAMLYMGLSYNDSGECLFGRQTSGR